MANALQMKALQDQVQQIANQIAVIDHSVREVIQGQQNDSLVDSINQSFAFIHQVTLYN